MSPLTKYTTRINSYLTALTIFVCLACQQAFATAFTFYNFDTKLTLDQTGAIPFIGNKPVYVRDLIVKTNGKLEASDLLALSSNIMQVTSLYKAPNFEYVLLALSDQSKSVELLARLNKLTSVLLVQPDILQIRLGPNAKRQDKVELKGSIPFYPWPSSFNKTLTHPIKVAIIDDGFDLTHPDFANIKVVFSHDLETNTSSAQAKSRGDSHGTKALSVLAPSRQGEISHLEFILIRQPSTWTSKTIAALNMVNQQQADVLNCSWSSSWLVEPVRDVINDLSINGRGGKGLPIVFAAGNQRQQLQTQQTEASIDRAIVVGTISKSLNKASDSNWGPTVDVYLANSKQKVASYGGGYSSFAGTSLAAALVSKELAVLLSQQPELTIEQLDIRLKNNTIPLLIKEH